MATQKLWRYEIVLVYRYRSWYVSLGTALVSTTGQGKQRSCPLKTTGMARLGVLPLKDVFGFWLCPFCSSCVFISEQDWLMLLFERWLGFFASATAAYWLNHLQMAAAISRGRQGPKESVFELCNITGHRYSLESKLEIKGDPFVSKVNCW